MKLTKTEAKEFLLLLRDIPACDNYLDNLLTQDKEYLSKYLFFKVTDQDLFGISPEGNFHIYSTDEVAIRLFATHEIPANSGLLFSYFENDSLLRKLFPRNWTSRPFYYLNKRPQRSEVTGQNSLVIRPADINDQELVNKWYASFNAEEGSNWPTPDLQTVPIPRLYLAHLDGAFVGAAANTLRSDSRLWVGRLWVDKSQRGKGIGDGLMKSIESLALSEGKTVSLLVSKENMVALKLYNNLKFQQVSLNAYWHS